MSDGPVRLIDPRSKSGAQMRLLIRAARADVPSDVRMRDLGARIGIGALAGAAKGASSVLALSVAKLCVVALLGAAVMAAAVAGRDADLSVAPPAATHTMRATAAPRQAARVIPRAPKAREEPRATPVASFAAPSAARDDEHAEDEGALLSEAQRALRSDPARALSLADRDARLHPAGSLAQEREVIAIEALSRLGRARDARARAAVFLGAWPRSAHRARIEQIAGPI